MSIGKPEVSHLVPALICKEDGEPVMSLLIDVMTGADQTSGMQAIRRLGISQPLLTGGAGAALDVLGHPLVWGAVGVAMASAQGASMLGGRLLGGLEVGKISASLVPIGWLAPTLADLGAEASQVAKAVIELVEREVKGIVGGAAIEVAEGLRLTLPR